MWIFGAGSYPDSSADLHIHHNQIYDTGTKSSSIIIGGIISDGFNALIENNVIDGVYGAGIVQKNVYSSAPSGSGYVLTLRNNIITNSRSSSGGSGCGVSNELTGTHSLSCRTIASTEMKLETAKMSGFIFRYKSRPRYADRNNHDYHLKSNTEGGMGKAG